MESTKSTINGLKYNVKRFHNGEIAANQKLALVSKSLVVCWNQVEPMEMDVWDLVKQLHLCIKVNDSSKCGIYSTIETYTNKKGVESKQHYTMYGNMCGSVKKLGKKPIGYCGNIPLVKDYFKYKYNPKSIDIEDMFVPIFQTKESKVSKKPIVEIDSDSDEELVSD